jgi:hypothetical protein
LSNNPTVEQDKATAPQADLAPISPLAEARKAAAERAPASLPVEQLSATPAKKRSRTSGENLFDATTYGGFALLGNEVASTVIVKGAKDAIEKGLHEKPSAELKGMQKISGMLGKAYAGLNAKSTALAGEKANYFHSASTKPLRENRFTYITFAIVGGFLMVPFIKVLEDNKGKLVRFADRMIHGKRAETDENMVQAHKEMDEAPQQNWNSLLKGRMTTVAAAFAVDTTINWENGLSARLMPNVKINSMEAASNWAADKGSAALTKMRGLTDQAAIKSQHAWLKNGMGLLTLSGALTVLFYASSKLFAAKREHRNEHRQEISRDRVLAESSRSTAHSHAERPRNPVLGQLDATEDKQGPSTTINSIEHQSRLHAPQLQEGLSA